MAIQETVRIVVESVVKGATRTLNYLNQFRMDMLGIMFYGMAIQRVFMGLLKPSADMFGIFELWGTTLSVVFLPTMEDLMPHFIKLSEILMDLPEPTKKIAGNVALFGVALGWIGQNIGITILGLSSIVQAFVGLGAVVSIVGIAFVIFIIGVIYNLIKLWGAIKNFKKNWTEAWDNFKKTVQEKTDQMLALWTIAWWKIKNIALYVFESLPDIAKTNITTMITTIKTLFNNFITWAASWGTRLGNAIWNNLPGWLQKLISGTSGIIGKAVKSIGGFYGMNNAPPAQLATPAGPSFLDLAGGKSSVNITQNLTVTGSLMSGVEKIIKDSNDRLTEEVKRFTGVRQ